VKPSYDPVALTVPDEEIDIDQNQVYWHGSERFTGITGETMYSGGYEFQSFKDGWLDGPSGEITPDGDLLVEKWYRSNFLYGITRTFRRDGTLATAVGYEYAYAVWTVRFDLDGSTVLSTEYADFNESQLKTLARLRSSTPLPPLRGPEDAADFSKH
jgi:hypothetical protein